MLQYSGAGLGSFYYSLLRDIRGTMGRNITVRGLKVRELCCPVVLEYEQPGYCFMLIPGRKFNPFFMMAEVPWILSGSGNVEWIAYFNKSIKNFQDRDDPDFHAAYGLRMRKWKYTEGMGGHNYVDQIEQAIDKLIADPFCRQAVISLWDPVRDNLDTSKDYPCNNLVYLSLREGRLDMTVVQRSNDVVWGTPHNAVQFTHLLAFITGWLNEKRATFPLQVRVSGEQLPPVRMGKITYFVQNIHYYYDLYPETLDILLDRATIRGKPEKVQPSGPGAVKHALFETVAPEALTVLVNSIEDKEGTFIYRNASYWNGVLPKLFYIYNVFQKEKDRAILLEEDVDCMTSCIRSVKEPFTSMILDFWKDSTNPLIQKVKEKVNVK